MTEEEKQEDQSRTFNVRSRLIAIRIPHRNEGPLLVGVLEMNDITGQRGHIVLAYDPTFLKSIGSTFNMRITIHPIPLEEYISSLPEEIRIAHELPSEQIGIV